MVVDLISDNWMRKVCSLEKEMVEAEVGYRRDCSEVSCS
jgi:hypothetical protein